VTLLGRLRATDDRLVPRLAGALRTGLDRLPGARAAEDGRHARRRPLAGVPALPQVVIAVVLLLGVALVVSRTGAHAEGAAVRGLGTAADLPAGDRAA